MTCPTWQASSAHACEPLEVRIRRFPKSCQRRIRKFVKGTKQFKDLAYSFPAALFTLAVGHRSPEMRGLGAAQVKAGRPLAEIASVLQLPLWTRQVPPEALGASFGALPDSEFFRRQIGNLIPDAEDAPANWLALLSFAFQACGEPMAIWLAGQRKTHWQPPANTIALLPVAAFIWFSQQQEEAAFRLIGKPWQKKMAFAKAAHETRIWFERVILDYCFEDHGEGGHWFKVRKSAGFRFVPLRTSKELQAEGERMANCVGSYAMKVAEGRCLIYAIQRGTKSVATLEVVADAGRPGVPRIAQLEGLGNGPVPDAVQRAVLSWISKQGRFPLIGHTSLAQVPVREKHWRRIWQSYLQAVPDFASLFEPTQDKMHRLVKALEWLERC